MLVIGQLITSVNAAAGLDRPRIAIRPVMFTSTVAPGVS